MSNMPRAFQTGGTAMQSRTLQRSALLTSVGRKNARFISCRQRSANIKSEQLLNHLEKDQYEMEVIGPSSSYRTNGTSTLERVDKLNGSTVSSTTGASSTETQTAQPSRSPLQQLRFERTITRPRQLSPLSRDQLANQVQAIVLAGGESGIPVAKHRALAAVPFGGSNLCLIDVAINSLITSGLNKMFVLAQYNSHTLINHVARSYPAKFASARNESFVDVITCNQTTSSKSWYRGAAEAVARNLQEFFQRGGDLAEYFVIASGSSLFDLDFYDLVKTHQEQNADVTIVTTCVSKEQAKRLGVVMVDSAGALTNFAEKPGDDILDKLDGGSKFTTVEKPYEASMGIYIFKRDVLFDLLSFPEVIHFGKDVIPAALSCGFSVSTTHHDGFWKDVSCLRDYYDASMMLTHARPPLDPVSLFANTVRPSCIPPAKLYNSFIDDCVIGDGVVIQGSMLVRSVVGNNTRISNGCSITDSLMMGNEVVHGGVGIGENTVLEKVVVDSNATIGRNSSITNKDGIMECSRPGEGFVIQDGIVAILQNAVIPEGTVI